eukprot:maker-scaffold_11-snap-gene-7.4-mRNA-1 protein AED:0.01 eAED:0.01 QI:64/0.5/0.6/1/0.5/0.4/5/86/696
MVKKKKPPYGHNPFMKFANLHKAGPDMVREIFSVECYASFVKQAGLSSSNSELEKNKLKFVEELSLHYTGSEGRHPFAEEVEVELAAFLVEGNTEGLFLEPTLRNRVGHVEPYHLKRRKLLVFELEGLESKIEDVLSGRFPHLLSSYETQHNTGIPMVLSTECYTTWVRTRKNGVKQPEYSFLRGKDGRKAFPCHIEKVVLDVIRQSLTWPCFKNNPDPAIQNIGRKGFKQPAFNELCYVNNKGPNKTKLKPKQLSSSSITSQLAPAPTQEFQPAQRAHKRQRPAYGINNEKKTHLDPCVPSIDTDFNLDFLSQEEFETLFEALEDVPNDRYSSMGSPYSWSPPQSVLETFTDVSREEVHMVNNFARASEPLFSQYYQRIGMSAVNDISGDVRLLRFLRSSSYDFQEALKRVDEFLNWRLRFDVNEIRMRLFNSDASISKLKRSFSIGNKGGCYPFFMESPVDGDVVDIFIVREQDKDDEDSVLKALYDHITLAEFRSIFFDSLSRLRRRVVVGKSIVDARVITDDSSWDSAETFDSSGFSGINKSSHLRKQEYDAASGNFANNISRSFGVQEPKHQQKLGLYDWFKTIKFWLWYLNQVGVAHFQVNAGHLTEGHLFGSGYLFDILGVNLMEKMLANFLGDNAKVHSRAQTHAKELYEIVGNPTQLPWVLGGQVTDPDGGSLAKMKISDVNRSTFS